MVILLKQHAPQAEQDRLLSWLRELGAEVRVTGTPERPFFCLTGDISRIDPSLAARFPAVEDVLRLTEPYPLCSRRLHPEPTVVSVGGARFGGAPWNRRSRSLRQPGRQGPQASACCAAGHSSRAPLPMIFPDWAQRGCACSSPPGTRRGFPSCPS